MIVDFWLITTDANSVPKSADALPVLSTSANVVSLAIVPASTGVYSVRATLMDDAVIASALIAWDVDTVGYVKHVVISRSTELDAIATIAKQEEIIATVQGSQVIQVPSANVGGNLVLTQGDTYDGIANPKATWNVTTDYTDGWAVALTIRDKDDVVVYTTTGAVDSATVVSVAITTPTVAPMAGCPGSWQGKFDVQLSKAGSVKTIALGVVYINEDQTR